MIENITMVSKELKNSNSLTPLSSISVLSRPFFLKSQKTKKPLQKGTKSPEIFNVRVLSQNQHYNHQHPHYHENQILNLNTKYFTGQRVRF